MKALLVVVALAGVASAGPKVDPVVQQRADALFIKGQTSYQEGKFQAAISQFKQAYDLVKDPVYLFNIAQSFRKIGDCVNAYDNYNMYLGAAPSAENRDKVRQWIDELKPCVDQRQRDQEDAAHKAQEEAERRQREEEARRGPGQPREIERDSGGTYRLGGIALGAVGVVGLGVGIGYGVRGQSLKSEIATTCAKSCQWDGAEIQKKNHDGEVANQRAWIGYIGGSIAVIGGAALYWYGRTRIETVSITPTSGGATVSAQLRF